jgi:uncharacterized protein YecT (DUF1311 family)
MRKIVSVLLFSLSSAAFANSACDVPKNDFDGLYCLNKVYIQSDKDLNTSYGALAKMLDKDGKKQLKSSQLDWIKQRNDNCSYSDNRGFFVNMDCATQTTIDRVQFLDDRLRECKSAGCQNSKL